jgi:hypothetical protein
VQSVLCGRDEVASMDALAANSPESILSPSLLDVREVRGQPAK